MSHEKRGLEFYVLAAFFALFVLFLYGPLSAILILSFQGPTGGLTFPLNGVSLHWFDNLFEKQAVGDFGGSLPALLHPRADGDGGRRCRLAARRARLPQPISRRDRRCSISPSPAWSCRRSSSASASASLFQQLGSDPAWYTSAFGAHLTWTLPFGVLIMFAVFNRFRRPTRRRRATSAPPPGRPSATSCCR